MSRMSDKSFLGESGVPSQQSCPQRDACGAGRAQSGFHRLVSHQLSQTVLDMVVSLARKLLMTRSLWMKGVVTIASGILTWSGDALLLVLWCFSSSLGVSFLFPCWCRFVMDLVWTVRVVVPFIIWFASLFCTLRNMFPSHTSCRMM